MSFRLVPKSVTLNGVMAVILRYFSEFGYRPTFRAHCVKFTFAISSPDEFLSMSVDVDQE